MQPLPGLTAVPWYGSTDIYIDVDDAAANPKFCSALFLGNNNPKPRLRRDPGFSIESRQTTSGQSTCLLYTSDSNYAEFVINPKGSHIWVTLRGEDTSLSAAVPFLLGPVLGCALRLRGIVCLHASVIRLGEVALAFLGPKGAGKSTILANLVQLGYLAITDDVAALVEKEDEFWVQPGIPKVRLCSDAAMAFSGSVDRLQPMWDHPQNTKFILDLDNAKRKSFQSEPLPLTAVYVLSPLNPGLSTVEITQLSATEGLVSLNKHSYMSKILDHGSRANEMAFLGRLSAAVPIRVVRRPLRLETVMETCEKVLADAQSL